MTSLLILCLLAALAAPLLGAHYLSRLPEAPSCPTCRRITIAEPGSLVLAHQLIERASPIQLRRCSACGWCGRMRWRWATERPEA